MAVLLENIAAVIPKSLMDTSGLSVPLHWNYWGLCSQLIIQGISNRSVNMPNRSAQKVFWRGIRTEPPAEKEGGTDSAALPWVQRLQLGLLQREAERLLKSDKTSSK